MEELVELGLGLTGSDCIRMYLDTGAVVVQDWS